MDNLTRRDREKLMREEEIISAAEKVFHEKSFDEAGMDEIAREAQFTKRTLYQYFENKEDLYFAVVLKGYKKLLSYLTEAYDDDKKTGYMRLEQSCRNLYQFYKENPDIFRMISYLGHVMKKPDQDSGRRSELMQFDKFMFQSVARVIIEGKTDGSINNSIDSEKAAFSLIFLMTGFLNQLSTTGDSFTGHLSLDIDEFSLYTFDLLLGALRNNSDPQNIKGDM